jgi:hypothetical protein
MAAIGLDTSAETFGGAILAAYRITPEVSLAGRAEYITGWGGDCGGASGCTPIKSRHGRVVTEAWRCAGPRS